MTEFGAFFLLENREDSLHHTNMGLSLPLKQSACFAEFTEVLTLRSPIQEVRLLHSCFVLNDSYAISVFMEPGLLEPETEQIFNSADDALEYMVGSDRLRDVITRVTVLDRTI